MLLPFRTRGELNARSMSVEDGNGNVYSGMYGKPSPRLEATLRFYRADIIFYSNDKLSFDLVGESVKVRHSDGVKRYYTVVAVDDVNVSGVASRAVMRSASPSLERNGGVIDGV